MICPNCGGILYRWMDSGSLFFPPESHVSCESCDFEDGYIKEKKAYYCDCGYKYDLKTNDDEK